MAEGRKQRWKRLENLLNEIEFTGEGEALNMKHNTIWGDGVRIAWVDDPGCWQLEFGIPEPITPDNT